jgi:hypothetical protein
MQRASRQETPVEKYWDVFYRMEHRVWESGVRLNFNLQLLRLVGYWGILMELPDVLISADDTHI